MTRQRLFRGAVAAALVMAASGCGLPPTVSQSPRAAIAATPLRGTAPFVATFDGSRSYDDVAIVAYEWTFDSEPTDAEGAACTHAFRTGGTHAVTLKVFDEEGNAGTARVEVIADNAPPLASFSLSDGAPIVNTTMIADGSGSGDPEGLELSLFWDFGDGAVAEGPIVTHTYSSEGAYLVTLVVRDVAGAEATASHRVLVQVAPTGGCSGGTPITL
jgi:PKD repeat protein